MWCAKVESAGSAALSQRKDWGANAPDNCPSQQAGPFDAP